LLRNRIIHADDLVKVLDAFESPVAFGSSRPVQGDGRVSVAMKGARKTQ
jgi:hypothetical protein